MPLDQYVVIQSRTVFSLRPHSMPWAMTAAASCVLTYKSARRRFRLRTAAMSYSPFDARVARRFLAPAATEDDVRGASSPSADARARITASWDRAIAAAGNAKPDAVGEPTASSRLPRLGTSTSWSRAVRRASSRSRSIAGPDAAWPVSVFRSVNEHVGRGLDHLVEDDAEPLSKPVPRVRAGWSRAVARAAGCGRSGLSRHGWDDIVKET